MEHFESIADKKEKWYPPNEWPHTCKFCGEKFLGRKNRKYCPDSKCKSAQAASIRNSNLELTKTQVDNIVKTVRIFKELPEQQERLILSTETIKGMGIDLKNTPSILLIDKYDKSKWYGVGPYEYKVTEDGKKIIIRKSK